jgi:hypothetical protein
LQLNLGMHGAVRHVAQHRLQARLAVRVLGIMRIRESR